MLHNYSGNRFLFIIPQITQWIKYIEVIEKKALHEKIVLNNDIIFAYLLREL